MFVGRLQYFQKIKFDLTKLIITKSKRKEKKRRSFFCNLWGICKHAWSHLIDWTNFFSQFLLTKESQTFNFFGIFCNLLIQSFLNFQSKLVGCFVKIIRNDQRQNIVSISSIVVTPLTVVIRLEGFDKYSHT